MDVLVNEPKVSPELIRRDDVVLLPHLGSATLETRVDMGLRAVENLRAFFESKTPLNVVTAVSDSVLSPDGREFLRDR